MTAGTGRDAANVLLVTYNPRNRKVPIRAGENSGRTLSHRGIVIDIHRAGQWSDAALRRLVLLQRSDGGPIIGAIRL